MHLLLTCDACKTPIGGLLLDLDRLAPSASLCVPCTFPALLGVRAQ